MEDVVKKYGLFNSGGPFCTRELKLAPMIKYIRSIGWAPGTYITAIGIRSDEADRMDEHHEEKLYWYPLIGMKVTKEEVRRWWKKQPFDLELPEHLGNCVWCWKKSNRKLFTLARNEPWVFEVPAILEDKYRYNFKGSSIRREYFFRGYMTTEDIFELSKRPLEEFKEEFLDKTGGCTESCDAFAGGTYNETEQLTLDIA